MGACWCDCLSVVAACSLLFDAAAAAVDADAVVAVCLRREQAAARPDLLDAKGSCENGQ